MRSLKEDLIRLVETELDYCKEFCKTNKEILISKNRVYGMVTLAFNHVPELDEELWDWWGKYFSPV